MTTKNSPPEKLREQAHRIAKSLKDMEAGGKPPPDPLGKIAASKVRGYIDFAIVMDDKIIKIEIPWLTINALEMPLLCDWIYDQMREAKDVAN